MFIYKKYSERRFIMKKVQNKLAVTAISFDVLTIIAIIVSFKYDLFTWAAIVLGVIAVVLNIKAKRKQKEKFQKHNE